MREDLEGFAASRGVIRFTPERPVPDAVVLRLVRLRLAEIRGDPHRGLARGPEKG